MWMGQEFVSYHTHRGGGTVSSGGERPVKKGVVSEPGGRLGGGSGIGVQFSICIGATPPS